MPLRRSTGLCSFELKKRDVSPRRPAAHQATSTPDAHTPQHHTLLSPLFSVLSCVPGTRYLPQVCRTLSSPSAPLHRRCSLPQISHTQIEHPHPHDNTAHTHTQHTHVRSSATPPHHGSHTHMVVLSRNSLSPSALLRSPPFKHVNGIQRGREVKSCTSVSRRSAGLGPH